MRVNILGIRGLPARHGGFETFAMHLSRYLISKQVEVLAYCQETGGARHPTSWTDVWCGIRRVHFETRLTGPLATIEFDIRCITHSLTQPGVNLVLGYNTAIFCALLRLRGRPIAMNMDGIEWRRAKWGRLARAWLWLNEWAGAKLATCPIADHPEIAAHLASRGCTNARMIPYGAPTIVNASVEPLMSLGVEPRGYFVSIARIEPENSILEIVQAFCSTDLDASLVVLGRFDELNTYHRSVRSIADKRVIFPGAIYDDEIVHALRFHCIAYLHGHQVGGTNPSLVEALGAGCAIIAHDNAFNRWVAGSDQAYFSDIKSCSDALNELHANISLADDARNAARRRHTEQFMLEFVHDQYLDLLRSLSPRSDNDLELI